MKLSIQRNQQATLTLAIKYLLYDSVIIMLSGTFLANRWTDVSGLIHFLPRHPIDSWRDEQCTKSPGEISVRDVGS